MAYHELTVLIPSHSLEDFPTEASEAHAAGLLNAFAVIWHPLLLNSARKLPKWWRADDPPNDLENRLILVPSKSEDWLPKGWKETAKSKGATVVSGCQNREELAKAVLEPLGEVPAVDEELVKDFYALGFAHLQLEILTRKMHHWSNYNQDVLARETLIAAEAAVTGDLEQARKGLAGSFDTLTNAREEFHSIDCYLMDLCLLIPSQMNDHVEKLFTQDTPVNVLLTGEDLNTIAGTHPETVARFAEAWKNRKMNFVGGDRRDIPVPLVPLESMLWELERGREIFQKHLGKVPRTWGKRRYGLTTMLPQVLARFGYHSALHVVLDDGNYPDTEDSKALWEGCDGSTIAALTRIPLAADSASSFLKLPERMAEAMQKDYVAGLSLARWPEMRTPFLRDLMRIQKYSPVFGKLVTIDEFVEHSETSGHYMRHSAAEYFTPFLVHHVARRLPDPVSRYQSHTVRRQEFDNACWMRAVARMVKGQPVNEQELTDLTDTLEKGNPDGSNEDIAAARAMLETFSKKSAAELTQLIMHGAGKEPGFLVINPHSFTRRATVSVPGMKLAPAVDGPIKAVQFDDRRQFVTVEVPGCGFVWLPQNPAGKYVPQKKLVPLADEALLQNEFLEVNINATTGGIARIKQHGRSPNRLSQQLVYRFPSERTFYVGEEKQQEKSYYSEMRCNSMEITSTGPVMGEIITRGNLINQVDGSKIADYVQTMRVWRGRPLVELEIELDPVSEFPEGDPWTRYYAARFAWMDITASMTRSVLMGAQPFQDQRFESPHYLEIADSDTRTTILNHGLTFHRTTGQRMLDSLLIPAGETQRKFRFSVALESDYPLETALDTLTPLTVIPTETGPPRVGSQGWFFHLSARNVQITKIMDLMPEVIDRSDEDPNTSFLPPQGFAVRLVETEGRKRTVKLRCFKTPLAARQRDFQGKTLANFRVEDDGVQVEIGEYEILDLELRFD